MNTKCTRCGSDEFDEPIENNANYVQGEDMVESEARTVLYALTHTELTRTIRDRLVDHWSINVTQANMAMATKDETYLKKTETAEDGTEQVVFDHTELKDDAFERVQVDSPVSPEEDAEIIKTVSEPVQVDTQKSGIVCPECVKESDLVIW